MSIKLQDTKLFILKNNEPLSVQITQSGQILFNLNTLADRSPINILLPIIEGNAPIVIKVNDYTSELLPDNLAIQQTYKLTLENGQLNQEVISVNDVCALQFKVGSPNITNNAQSIINGSTLSSLQQSQLRHKLIEQGKGTSLYQSASSLRHSIPEVSFCQASRFEKDSTLKTEFNYSIPDTIGSAGRSTGFGYGGKYICPLFVQRNAEQNPPPNAYFADEIKKPTQYRKTTWSQTERFKMSRTQKGPGPAQYDVTQVIGQDKPSCTIGAIIKPLPKFAESVPAPNTYELKTKIVEPSRFSKIALGYGNKLDFTKNDKTPGPGTYEQPSVFKNLSTSILSNGTLRTNVMRQ